MPIPEKEAVAGLRLLALVAKADGELSSEERAVMEESLTEAKLPDGITAQGLFDGGGEVASLARDITSQEGRDVAFSACFTMAYADRECRPAEQAVLDAMAREWHVPKRKKALLGRILTEARKTVWSTRSGPTVDPARREAEVGEDILKYSVIAGVLGLNPIPVASIVTDVAVVGLQAKMFSDIGRHWGHETTRDTARQVYAGVGAGTGVRLAANALMKFVPGAGSLFAASTNFASTWALGRVSNRYWESGGRVDMKMLRGVFVKGKVDGREAFERNREAVEARHRVHEKTLEKLADDYGAARMTLEEYEKQVAELK